MLIYFFTSVPIFCNRSSL